MLFSLAIVAFLSSSLVAPVVPEAEHSPFHHQAQDSSTFSGSDGRSWPGNFFLFGRVLLPDGTWNRSNCQLRLSVRIGNKVWEQPLDSPFFAFQAPADVFSGMVGTFAVLLRSHQRLWEPLWTQSFLIEGSSSSEVSFQELEADITTALPLIDKCSADLASTEISLSPSETRISLPVSSRANSKPFCPASASDWQPPTCPSRAEDGIVSTKNSAIHSTGVSLAIATLSELRIEDETFLTVSTWLQLPPDDRAANLASLLHSRVVISFSWLFLLMVLISVLYLVRSMWNHRRKNDGVLGKTPKSAAWQVRLCCPSSDGTVRGQSFRAKTTLVDAGRGCFRDAWEESELRLRGLHSENCCFYYNCGSENSQGKQTFQPGRWNRDKTGRLIKTAD